MDGWMMNGWWTDGWMDGWISQWVMKGHMDSKKSKREKEERRREFFFGNGKHWKQLDNCQYNLKVLHRIYFK